MHDIKLIRENPTEFARQMQRRGADVDVDELLEQDKRSRKYLREVEELQAEIKKVSEKIGSYMRSGEKQKAMHERDWVAETKQRIAELEEGHQLAQSEITEILECSPNLIKADVPDGKDEADNKELFCHGEHRDFEAEGFEPFGHSEIGESLGLDFERAVAMSGARFALLRSGVARLHRALGQFMIDHNIAHGFEECAPPLLVREDALYGTGQLPKFAEECFRTVDGRWLIPTAEVSLTNIVRESILAEKDLPLRFTALTPCFRSEAGAAGKDTKGLIRQHQFDKVELVTIATEEQAEAEHAKMTQCAEEVLQKLELPYRKMLLCAGDMGASAMLTYDLEVWLPAQKRYREIASISDCGTWQARRMDARYRPSEKQQGKGATRFVNTLNGSSLAVGRALVAVLENYQQKDGSVDIPKVLHSYMGGVTRLEPKG